MSCTTSKFWCTNYTPAPYYLCHSQHVYTATAIPLPKQYTNRQVSYRSNVSELLTNIRRPLLPANSSTLKLQNLVFEDTTDNEGYHEKITQPPSDSTLAIGMLLS